MPDPAHIATWIATDPLIGLLLAIPFSLALIIPSVRVWWIHAPTALGFLVVSLLYHDTRHLAFDSYLIGIFAFSAVCRDIPNSPLLYRVGILWFAAWTLVATLLFAAYREQQLPIPAETGVLEQAISA